MLIWHPSARAVQMDDHRLGLRLGGNIAAAVFAGTVSRHGSKIAALAKVQSRLAQVDCVPYLHRFIRSNMDDT
jgi:hypothetical protein